MTGKIIGFAQLRNELSKGNLINWFKCMSICDWIYIYDQASEDGSLDEYAKHSNVTIIKSDTNRFGEEIPCKSELLDLLLKDNPDTQWILWMDGDTCLDNRLMLDDFLEFRSMLREANQRNVGGIALGHYNLWRSNKHFRVDSGYHNLDGGVIALWKNNGMLSFPKTQGLHQAQHPDHLLFRSGGLWFCNQFKLIHYGFATDDQIIIKYDLYKSLGQSGWNLDRLLCEKTLKVEEAGGEMLPSFIDTSQCVNPTTKRPLAEIYKEKMQRELDDE